MAKYRKKPVIIDAIKFDKYVTPEMVRNELGANPIVFEAPYFYIDTLEGRMEVSIGDYVMKGIKGEFYPCKPDIFEGSYDAV